MSYQSIEILRDTEKIDGSWEEKIKTFLDSCEAGRAKDILSFFDFVKENKDNEEADNLLEALGQGFLTACKQGKVAIVRTLVNAAKHEESGILSLKDPDCPLFHLDGDGRGAIEMVFMNLENNSFRLVEKKQYILELLMSHNFDYDRASLEELHDDPMEIDEAYSFAHEELYSVVKKMEFEKQLREIGFKWQLLPINLSAVDVKGFLEQTLGDEDEDEEDEDEDEEDEDDESEDEDDESEDEDDESEDEEDEDGVDDLIKGKGRDGDDYLNPMDLLDNIGP